MQRIFGVIHPKKDANTGGPISYAIDQNDVVSLAYSDPLGMGTPITKMSLGMLKQITDTLQTPEVSNA